MMPMTGITAADQMGGIVTWRCDCGNQEGGRYAQVRIHRRRCRRSVSVKWAGFHVTGPRSGSLGASFVSADLKVRVLWSSGIVDIPNDRLYVRMYVLLLCLGALMYAPVTSPFILKHDCPFSRTPVGVRIT